MIKMYCPLFENFNCRRSKYEKGIVKGEREQFTLAISD